MLAAADTAVDELCVKVDNELVEIDVVARDDGTEVGFPACELSVTVENASVDAIALPCWLIGAVTLDT